MPGRYKVVPYALYDKYISKLTKLSDSELLHYSSYLMLSVEYLCEKHRLPLNKSFKLLKLFLELEHSEYIIDTQFRFLLSRNGMEIEEPFKSFFFLEVGKGFVLSSLGIASLSEYTTFLRRVLQDKQEYYRCRFQRFTKGERDKRRANQRFWALSESEQVKILRDYWVLPYRNDEEKRERKRVRMIIYRAYDLKNWDLINAVKKHGDIVRSVRELPEHRDKFEYYLSSRNREKKRKGKGSDSPSDNNQP
jgi:hypothetical protein